MKNLLEGTVVALYDELRVQNPELCGCDNCRTDVIAFALNAAHPRYSGGTDVGQALISVDLQRDQTRAALAVIVLDAMQRVAANPRHKA
ncbi:MAG TPA: late competence development ComFB family protein [Gemmatimonadaceae bacterium]|jgi:competence protein ComFB|nr:late competence development ComFB family protein [Gemmatimonadaceae bacterium]